MRDGLPVMALVVAVVALLVALAGIRAGPPEVVQPPAEQLSRATRRLDALIRERESMRKDLGTLEAKVTRANELGPIARGGEVDRAKIRAIVAAAVEETLRTRLEQEAKKAGAPPAKSTAVRQQFEGMLAEVEKTLALDENKGRAMRNVLQHLRGELNRAYANRDLNQRAALAKAARARADQQMAKVLGPGELVKYKAWRTKSANPYVARFFGLKAPARPAVRAPAKPPAKAPPKAPAKKAVKKATTKAATKPTTKPGEAPARKPVKKPVKEPVEGFGEAPAR